MFLFFRSNLLSNRKLYPAFRHIEWRHFQSHYFTDPQFRRQRLVSSRRMRVKHMPVGQLCPKQLHPENFHYLGVEAYGVFDRHVRISGSDSVIKTVCSKWAES